jgi:hypothetical protein
VAFVSAVENAVGARGRACREHNHHQGEYCL